MNILQGDISMNIIKKEPPIFFNAETLAAYLNVKKQTIRLWTMQGRLKHYKFGRACRYKREEIDEWIAEQRVKADK
jgi:excisionase family DNA binding protein